MCFDIKVKFYNVEGTQTKHFVSSAKAFDWVMRNLDKIEKINNVTIDKLDSFQLNYLIVNKRVPIGIIP